MKTNIHHLVANDATEAILANAADGGSPFAILQGDGFLVPFGDFPHKHGLQLFDRAAAEEILATHNGTLAKLTRFITGGSYPIYVGHPDLPGSKDADKRAYGWIENMSITDEGLHLTAKWSEAGRELVENAHFKFYSPLWWTKKVKGGIRPIALKSMGLTNDPNIPVPALANEAEEQDLTDPTDHSDQTDLTPTENKEPMKPEILAALGLEEGATPDDVLAKITETQTAANEAVTRASEFVTVVATANSEIARLETDLTTANGTITDAEAKAKEADEEKTEAENQVSDLKARLQIVTANAIEHAVTAGRITPAEAEAKTAEVMAANDLAAALQDLRALPAKVKTESKTGPLGEAKARLVIAANDDAAAARAERAQLVANEFEKTNPALSKGERKRISWERARAKTPDAFTKKDSSGAAA